MRMLICLIGLTLFAQQVSLRGTWSATEGSRQLAGRWTARPGGEGGSVSGTWEVVEDCTKIYAIFESRT